MLRWGTLADLICNYAGVVHFLVVCLSCIVDPATPSINMGTKPHHLTVINVRVGGRLSPIPPHRIILLRFVLSAAIKDCRAMDLLLLIQFQKRVTLTRVYAFLFLTMYTKQKFIFLSSTFCQFFNFV